MVAPRSGDEAAAGVALVAVAMVAPRSGDEACPDAGALLDVAVAPRRFTGE